MPIATCIQYRCSKCGYTYKKTVGDVIVPSDVNPQCPYCKLSMKSVISDPFPCKDRIREIWSILKRRK